jgi:hypothetical protein
MSDEVELLRRVYVPFNCRDVERALAAMHPDVVWQMNGRWSHPRTPTRCAAIGSVNGRSSIRMSSPSRVSPNDESVFNLRVARDPGVYVRHRDSISNGLAMPEQREHDVGVSQLEWRSSHTTAADLGGVFRIVKTDQEITTSCNQARRAIEVSVVRDRISRSVS